jgi:hypothetical protein
MSILTPHISFKRRLFSSSGWAFFTMLIWECVESLLEYAIAYVISSAITMLVIKLVATFLIITATQVATRQVHKFVLAFVRKLTYRKGDDKVKTLKNTFKKIWELIKANKCSLVSIFTAVLLAVSGTGVIDVNELPAISLGSETVIEAVVQEEDLVATEIVYGKEAVLATEIIYGEPIFATEVVWEKEPVYASEVVWEVEPIIATETIYSVEPVIADKLTFIANTVIYEDDGTTIKYNVGDVVLNSEVGAYTDSVDVFQAGDIIKEGTILYNKGDIIKEGTIKFNVGDVVEEGIIKYDVGDYIKNEILYNVGDVIVPAEILYNVGDVIIAKGTVLEEAKTIPPFNVTPYIYYALLAIVAIVVGVFFEKPKDYAERKENEALKKEAQKEIKQEDKKAVTDKEKEIVAQEQKVVEAEKQKNEALKRARLEAIKSAIRAEKAN